MGALGAEGAALGSSDAARLAQLNARTGQLDRQAGMYGASDKARLDQLNARFGALDRQGTALGAEDKARLDQLNARTGQLDRSYGAAKDAFGMDQQGITNRFGASDRAAGLADAGLDAARTRLGVGQVEDAQTQAELLAQNDLYNRQRDAPYDRLQKLLSMTTTGIGQQAGVKQETPWWQSALGGALGLGSLFL
jgi:hypothetical protein